MAKRTSEGETLKQVKRIGRLSYDRNDLIGTGSFGKVYKGKFKESEEKSEIDVAIKRIEDVDVKTIEKVIMENIEPHPNVLHCYCIEEDEDFIYIATELCAGTLEDIIEGKYQGPPVGSPRIMMRQIARGLEHLHKNNIVHRDIKPANILVSFPNPETNQTPLMKLADFGLCRLVKTDGSESYLTKCGSKGWQAPELYSKAPPITDKKAMFAVDIFSLGCVFAYSLSKGNQHPFGSKNLRDYRIENEDKLILTYEDFDQYGDGPVIYNMIRRMLFITAAQRDTIKDVMEHPFFSEAINEENSSSNSLIDQEEYETIISSLNHLVLNSDGSSTYHYDVNKKDNFGRTPLMLLLCSKNHESGIKLVDYIEKFLSLPNVDKEVINATDIDGNSALTLLCEHYNGDDLIDIVHHLIQKGANVNQVTFKNGFNALMLLCVQYNHERLIEIIRLFIENGVDLNTKSTDDGWNILHIVCRYYNNNKLVEIVTLLIENGINLNSVTTTKGWNALAFLCLHYTGDCMLRIIQLFVKNGMDVSAKAKSNGFNALLFVSIIYTRDDLIDVIKLLIEKDPAGINCASQNDGNNSLLMICCQKHTSGSRVIDTIRLLIDSGIDVNHRSNEGWNALMALCCHYRQSNLMEIVKLLVGHGIDMNCKNIYGLNAFTILCQNEYLNHTTCLDVFRSFIELDADVNAVFEVDGNNALILLCKYHNNCEKLVDIIRLVLDNSTIDVNYKNKKGEDAMFTLKSKGRLLIRGWESIIQLLVERGACCQ